MGHGSGDIMIGFLIANKTSQTTGVDEMVYKSLSDLL